MFRRFLLIASLIAVPSSILATAPSASAAVPVPITIHVDRTAGDVWWSSGAFTDAGVFEDVVGSFAGPATYHVDRTFTGADGTFTMRGDVRLVATSSPTVLGIVGRWAILSGTGAYAGMHGAGTIDEVLDFNVGITGIWSGIIVA